MNPATERDAQIPPPAARDVDLVRKAQGGDAEAISSLFRLHRGRVYAVCLRMTRNQAEAEDLTQEAFIQVLRRISLFRGDSSFSTWLYRVAVNTVLMHFRKQGPPVASLANDAEDGTEHRPKSDVGKPDNRLRASVERLAIMRALETLSPGYRRIFELHEIEGYEHQEIARLLHCSVGNSKSQLHKARLQLRRRLRPSKLRRFPSMVAVPHARPLQESPVKATGPVGLRNERAPSNMTMDAQIVLVAGGLNADSIQKADDVALDPRSDHVGNSVGECLHA
jgi:RNA polymerase sigma-70 factor (ECF subfamily)